MNYTDQAAVQNYLLTSIDGTFTAQLTEWIAAQSRFMDTYCARTLVDTEATTRLFDGDGSNTLMIDEMHSISEITVSDVVKTPYQYPANSSRKTSLVLDLDYFTRGYQNVAVTGIFAQYKDLADAPEIKFACTVLVAGIVNANKKQNDDIASEKIGQYSVSYKTDEQRNDFKRAMMILDNHRRLTF